MASPLNALHTLPTPLIPASGFWARGKSLVKFYKAGISNIWYNRTEANKIRQKYGSRTGVELCQSIVESSHLAGIEHNVLKSTRPTPIAVKRNELLTLIRTEKDLKKLPLFVVVFAICFELTPIVLWGAPRIAPSTCWSASFNKKLREKYTEGLDELHKYSNKYNGSESVFRLDSTMLRSLASVLDFGSHYRILPTSLLQQRMLKHLTYVRADDAILRQHESELDTLDKEELVRALMARALPLEGGLDALRYWLAYFKEPMDAGFFIKDYKVSYK